MVSLPVENIRNWQIQSQLANHGPAIQIRIMSENHHPPKQVALILQTRMQENIGILEGIAAYERINCDWIFFLDDQAMSVRDPQWLFRKDWDGVICRHLDPIVLRECEKRGIPCVDLEDIAHDDVAAPKVKPDNRAVGHVGAEHLLDRGYQHFGFCGYANESWSIDRRSGFVEAIEAVKLECELLETDYIKVLTPEWDLHEQEIISEWLKRLPKPVAIMACHDMRALQVIGAATQSGFRIPDEIAVLGSNNETVRAELSHPPLSSVPLNTREWGETAAMLLHRQMTGKSVEPLTYIEPLPVVVRRSTEALAIEDPVVKKALKIIREEACSYLRVEELAERVNVSRSLLDRLFRKFLRRTPQDEIRQVRINKAKKFLIETDLTLADIAEQTGFDHPEYLSVMFKRMTSETPRDFRARCRQRL